MVEDKTREQQPELVQPGQRKSWRSCWAKLQCAGVLCRYKLRRKVQNVWEKAAKKLCKVPAYRWAGEALYGLGYATEYAFVRAGRRTKKWFCALEKGTRKLLKNVFSMAFPGTKQVLWELFAPFILIVRGTIALVRHANRTRKEKGLWYSFKTSVLFLVRGVAHNISALPRMAMYVLPAGAVFLMVTVCQQTMGQSYALQVQVDGQSVGYVANETVFNSALETVQERINYAGTDKVEWTVEPTYSIAVSQELMDENDVVDAIMMSASDEISEGTALYLDGELTAICADGDALTGYLDGLMEPYQEPDDPNTSVSFNKEVQLENGIYFNESFQEYDEIEEMLSGVQQAQRVYTVQSGDTLWGIAQKNDLTFKELCNLNPDFKGEQLNEKSSIKPGDELIVTKEETYLEVRISKIVTWEESIPYTTITEKSDKILLGKTEVAQQGVEGVRSVTAECVYDTSGNLLSQNVLSSEVVREPIPQKVLKGNKNSYISGSGQFIWPVPSYRRVSRWYGGSHRGVDITGALGTPIYATAAGTVQKSGYERAGAGTNYGYSIILNHGNGYTSVYAHCSSLVVSAGQYVQQGQLLGYMGSTGRSTGVHLHFEIRQNGSYIPPQSIFDQSLYRTK